MSAYRTLNQTVLAKVESVAGQDAVPVVGTDAVLVENPTRAPDLRVVETNEVTGALDDRGPLPAGGSSPFNFDVWLKGADTPGTAPEFGPLMKGCAFAETLTAAAITGVASAGATGSITVETADYAAIAVGMVITTTSGLGSGQTRVITAKPGSDVVSVFPNWTTTPDGTTNYSVVANALYTPTSSNIDTLSMYRYRHRSDGGDSKLDKVLGAAGNVSLQMAVGEPCRMSFAMQGQLSAPTDVTPPAAATYQAARAQPYLGADTYLGQVATKLAQFQMDVGNTVQLVTNPAQAFGFDAAGITRRRSGGRINPPQDLQSVRDAFSSWLTGSTQPFWVRWGTVPGNRVSIYSPTLLFSGVEEEDVNGFAHEGLPFRVVGANTAMFLCLH
jgi:hypothetical protein